VAPRGGYRTPFVRVSERLRAAIASSGATLRAVVRQGRIAAAFVEERQGQIAKHVSTRGRATIAELVALTGVNASTVRRDLSQLERRKELKRTHGGAIAVHPMFEPELSSRELSNVEAKEAIAAACMQEIQPGSSLFLDSGSTVLRIAERLAGHRANVLTNSIAVAEAVVDFPGVSHTVLGGQLRRTGGCFVGPLALEAVRHFTVNVAFIGASGISAEGITEADLSESQPKAAVIARARRVVVPIDHSKVGSTDFALIAPLDEIDLVITDVANDELQAFCETHGVEVRVAPVEQPPVETVAASSA
jgi:DeoR/GlpR family transcriptional regulator of sugar metabolism